GLLYWPAFRRRVARGVRAVLIDAPAAVANSPVVQAVFDNAATRFFARYLLIPLLSGGLLALALRLLGIDGPTCLTAGGVLAVLIGGFFRTQLGREIEERLNEALDRFWRRVSVNLIVGLLNLILAIFRTLLEWIERAIYAVDERLRFREGD